MGLIAVVILITFTMAGCSGSPSGNRSIIIPDTPATRLVKEIKLGWHLNCALDTSSGFPRENPTVCQMETGYGTPATTKENITAIKNAGFNAIRIGVAWHKAIDSDNNIRQDWMARVTEVVNYAVDNEMYIILNSHNDEHIFKLENADVDASLTAFKKIWKQIADNFKNYDEKLIFEAINEPRTIGSPAEWYGGTSEERANLNRYYQVFVDVVRASGGNNGKRFLIVNPMGAGASPEALNGFTLPTDQEPGRLIVSVHSYAPNEFCFPVDEAPWANESTWSKNNSYDTLPITDPIDLVYNTFVSKGIPVIMGETGATDKNNTKARVEWAEFFVSYARSKGIPCFLCDCGGKDHAIINRRNNTYYFPEYIRALLKGTGISDIPPLPVLDPHTFNFIENNPGDWSYEYTDHLLFNESGIVQGNTYTFSYSFSSNVAMNYLQVFLVDCNATTNYAWNELSNRVTIKEAIAANTIYSGEITINATGTATRASPNANRIHFSTGTASAPTLTFTRFEIKNNGGTKQNPASWTWGSYDDSNAITVSGTAGTHSITGNVTDNGYVHWYTMPDYITLTNLRAANSISFKIKGDGKTYKVFLPTKDIMDYSSYFAAFPTTNGVETTVTLNLGDFAQPNWGVRKPFTKSAIQNISWSTNDGALGSFSLTIRDLVINK